MMVEMDAGGDGLMFLLTARLTSFVAERLDRAAAVRP